MVQNMTYLVNLGYHILGQVSRQLPGAGNVRRGLDRCHVRLQTNVCGCWVGECFAEMENVFCWVHGAPSVSNSCMRGRDRQMRQSRVRRARVGSYYDIIEGGGVGGGPSKDEVDGRRPPGVRAVAVAPNCERAKGGNLVWVVQIRRGEVGRARGASKGEVCRCTRLG